jgi:hypothetical protein
MPKLGRTYKPKKKDVKYYSTTINQRGHKITKNGEQLAWVVAAKGKEPLQVAVDGDGKVTITANGWDVSMNGNISVSETRP